MKRTSILLVDDHPCIKDALDTYLNGTPYIILHHATSFEQALELLHAASIDLVILDLWLGDGNGEDLIPVYLERYPDLPILIFSAIEDIPTVARCLHYGAKGFFPKPSSFKEILKALNTLCVEQSLYLPDSIRNRLPKDGSQANVLTPRERQILSLIALSYNTKQIAERLDISENTVNNQRSSLMNKLNLRDIASATRYAISSGLVSASERLPAR